MWITTWQSTPGFTLLQLRQRLISGVSSWFHRCTSRNNVGLWFSIPCTAECHGGTSSRAGGTATGDVELIGALQRYVVHAKAVDQQGGHFV